MKNTSKIAALILFLLWTSQAMAADVTRFHFGAAERQLSSATTEVAAGYYDHQFLTTVFTGLTSANIKSGVTIGGITGTYGAGGMLPPTLTTTAVSNVTDTTASSGGNISTDGGSAVTARGVCWNTTGSPTTAESKTTDGAGTGSFTSSLTGLTVSITYYVRAYATNSVGTAYGNQVSFTTAAVLPALTTATVTNIGTASATSGGNITSDGGASVTARGVCWNTGGSPTTAESKTTDGAGTGSFTSSLTGLTATTTYYVRAYATNSVGTAYGDQVSFTTTSASAYAIGQSYGGGIIFYVDGSGVHGLIAAASDQSTGIAWGSIGVVTGATGTAVGTGQANTTAIVNKYGAGSYAAKLCDDLVLNSYSDWFLPSEGELQLMGTNLKQQGLGGFSDESYWSSTENSDNAARAVYLTDNYTLSAYKTNTRYVRAVRKF